MYLYTLTNIKPFLSGHIHVEVDDLFLVASNYKVTSELAWCEPERVKRWLVQLEFTMNPEIHQI